MTMTFDNIPSPIILRKKYASQKVTYKIKVDQ